jgi:hypothetical protein
MANFDIDRLAGGDTAGGVFNLSDADFIALATQQPAGQASKLDPILAQSGATTGATDETWGISEV